MMLILMPVRLTVTAGAYEGTYELGGLSLQNLSIKDGAAKTHVNFASANPSHLFTVNDAKGLLLTCIAPEIDTNAETDVFKSCALAPGRTLDDVMHTFVQGIHYEQSQHQKEREEWQKNLEEDPDQKPVVKQ